ncbi:GIY-YIG nuclease family protein [Candidatus Microgenomates bacterium]|nr:GIY-YIG nuclease family protein [Candidatus Microgenomates bacterium]
MKGFVYILKNENTGRYYIGSTNNLSRRLKQHEAGFTRTTRILGTNSLVYKEECDTIQEARAREKKLKSYKSKRYIEWLIKREVPVVQSDRTAPS